MIGRMVWNCRSKLSAVGDSDKVGQLNVGRVVIMRKEKSGGNGKVRVRRIKNWTQYIDKRI